MKAPTPLAGADELGQDADSHRVVDRAALPGVARRGFIRAAVRFNQPMGQVWRSAG
jgi:hypothetical protein